MRAPGLPTSNPSPGSDLSNASLRRIEAERTQGLLPGQAPGVAFPASPGHQPGTARVNLPNVAASVDQMPQADRVASTTLAQSAKDLVQQTRQGAAVGTLAAQASDLYQNLQGRTLTAADATEIKASLDQAGERLHRAPYAQGQVIPPEQSEAEGQIARSRDLVDLALRAPRS